uniref:Glycoside hydrolase family 5 domain-containing protein n=1 Tax=Globodera rostochiensis TaxID=31243 RepID=A0A914H2U7_GLORO
MSKGSITCCCFLLLAIAVLPSAAVQSPPYGQLQVQGSKLMSSSGKQIILRGMSLFWSQWDPKYWNAETVNQLKCKWGINILRAPMGVEGSDGYLQSAAANTANTQKLMTVVDACINAGIYVIIDWHYTSGTAYTDKAVEFFKKMAQKYGKNPHILYEVWNEPVGVDWKQVLKPYHQRLISAIRTIDPDNVILLGTPNYSMDLNSVVSSPITGQKNIMYSFHFYAADSTPSEQTKQQNMVKKVTQGGLPVFVTESGAGSGGSNSPVNLPIMNQWLSLLEQLKISYIIWGVRGEGNYQNPLKQGTAPANVGLSSSLTDYGKVVKNVFTKNGQPKGC